MSIVNSTLLLDSAGAYQVQRSVRLRAAASAWLTRSYVGGTTPADTNSRKKTYSMWVKRGALGSVQELISNYISNTNFWGLYFDSNDTLVFSATDSSTVVCNKITSQVFRDPSAWYHIVLATDSTNAIAEDRAIIYVNRVRVTAWSTNTTPTLNNITAAAFLSPTGGTWFGNIGRLANGANYLDGYVTEVYCVDGQQLDPTSFGEQDTATRMWVPKKYTGSFGTNGFYLNFSDITSTTTLGNDKSGNGNNWTANNISLTSGSTYDSMLDVPGLPWADGGNGRGNYATLNPVWGTNSAGNTYADGNLKLSTNGSSSTGQARSTLALPETGKFYCEMRPTNFVCSTSGTSTGQYGILAASESKQIAIRTVSAASSSLTSAAIYKDNVLQTSITTPSLNDVFGFAVDCGAGTVQIFVNNVSVWSGSYSVTSEPYFFGFAGDSGTSDRDSVTEFNFGQRPFAYTPPTGFKALNTANLPDPTGAAAKPWEHFDVSLWVGTGASQTITNSGFKPDFVWPKQRSAANDHILMDSVRGLSVALFSNLTNAEVTDSTRITSLNSNGFTLGSSASTNASGGTFVGWQWKAGGAAVSNTAGSITSQVSANTAAGVSVVTYTGNLNAAATVGHGLGVVPAMIITKARGAVGEWMVKHKSLASNFNLILNQSLAANSATATYSGGGLADLSSSSTFGFLSGSSSCVNSNPSTTVVAYCFAEIPGFSKFGSYTGNGSADGPFVFCGFRPKYILRKCSSSAYRWFVLDAARNTYNVMDAALYPNYANAEEVSTVNWGIDFCSNGFKIRSTDVESNANGGTYIYAAFAESPFKWSNAR